MNPPHNIFILGCGRSGTSMLAGLFRESHFFLGENSYVPRESNPKGFFEDRNVNTVNEAILTPYLPPRCHKHGIQYGTDSPDKGQSWLARISLSEQIEINPNVEKDLLRLITDTPFCYKDPRFSYTLHIWRRYVETAKFICVFREPGEVVSSILKEMTAMPYLHNFSMSVMQAFELWKLVYSHILKKHSKKGQWLFVNYSQVFSNSMIDRVAAFAQCNLDKSFPDPRLCRSRPIPYVDKEVDNIYNELLRKSRDQ